MNRILKAYEVLQSEFGPQEWWPSEGTFETAVGAVLTQGTSWTNAERAVGALRSAEALTPEGLLELGEDELLCLIRPAGFRTRKAATLVDLARLAGGTSAGWKSLLSTGQSKLRTGLLELRGVGPETADVILLYAAGYAAFVVDEYTRRFAARHALLRPPATYDRVQELFVATLPRDNTIYSEYHALLVRLGKSFCRTKPLCGECPLAFDLPESPHQLGSAAC